MELAGIIQLLSCGFVHKLPSTAFADSAESTEKKDKALMLCTVSGSDLAFVKKRWAWCVLPSGVFIISAEGKAAKQFAAPGN